MCDLVHPNLGSTFLLVRDLDGKLVAGGKGGNNQALFIVAPTLAGVIGAHKEIQSALIRLEESKLTHGA
jgi:hypothetical protein